MRFLSFVVPMDDVFDDAEHFLFGNYSIVIRVIGL